MKEIPAMGSANEKRSGGRRAGRTDGELDIRGEAKTPRSNFVGREIKIEEILSILFATMKYESR